VFSSHRIGGHPHLGIVRTARVPHMWVGDTDDTHPHPPIRDIEDEEDGQ
jgi:hypothetical protein